MMFVGKCLCTSHVLQYSSCLSYEHSRSPQSFLCSGAVTVLICSFFVAALLILHNFKKRQQIYTLFHNPPNIFQTIFRPKLHIHKVYKKISGHGVTGTVGHETVSRLLRKRRENLEVTNKVRIFAHGLEFSLGERLGKPNRAAYRRDNIKLRNRLCYIKP